MARFTENETDDTGCGGQAEPLGFLDNRPQQSAWPNPWRFFTTWGHCYLDGSWLRASPYVGFSLLIDPDLVQAAKLSLELAQSDIFDTVLFLLEQERKSLRHSANRDRFGNITAADIGETMCHYLATLNYALDRFALDLQGIHGIRHWFRVLYYGLKIAHQSRQNQDIEIIILFALLHDVERHENGLDKRHGQRAARLISDLQGDVFRLSPDRLQLLIDACDGHSGFGIHSDPTVQTCWDADKLDLTRQGIRVDPARLMTIAGKRLALEQHRK